MKPVVVSACVCVALAAASIAFADTPRPLLVWNLTPSVPRGLYWMSPIRQPKRGDLVASQLPPAAATFAARRGYLSERVPVAKEVIGTAGDTICAFQTTVYLNGAKLIERRRQDQFGRPMPFWQGCVVIAPGQVFLAMPQVAQSFDGRYFGPTPVADIEGRLHSLWTF